MCLLTLIEILPTLTAVPSLQMIVMYCVNRYLLLKRNKIMLTNVNVKHDNTFKIKLTRENYTFVLFLHSVLACLLECTAGGIALSLVSVLAVLLALLAATVLTKHLSFTLKIFMMDKVLSSKLFCLQTGLVPSFSVC